MPHGNVGERVVDGDSAPSCRQRLEVPENMKGFSDHITCPVCLELLQDPCVLQCGHTFCRSCIQAVRISVERTGAQPRCPVDRKALVTQGPAGSLQQLECNPNYTLRAVLSTFRVRCRNAYRHCPELEDWTLRDEDARCPAEWALDNFTAEEDDAHAKVCQFQMVACDCVGCTFSGTRRDLGAHIAEHGPGGACRLCGERYHAQDMALHRCKNEIVLCPNSPEGCLCYVQRSRLEEHLKGECRVGVCRDQIAKLQESLAAAQAEQEALRACALQSYTIFVKFEHLGSTTRTLEVSPGMHVNAVFDFIGRVHRADDSFKCNCWVLLDGRILERSTNPWATLAALGIVRDTTLYVRLGVPIAEMKPVPKGDDDAVDVADGDDDLDDDDSRDDDGDDDGDDDDDNDYDPDDFDNGSYYDDDEIG